MKLNKLFYVFILYILIGCNTENASLKLELKTIGLPEMVSLK